MATTDTYQAPESLPGVKQFGMAAAAVGVVLAGVGFMMAGIDRFYEAYLVAWTYWAGVGLGSLALLMVQHLTGGAWGVVLRRPLEAAVKTLPATNLTLASTLEVFEPVSVVFVSLPATLE